MLANAAIADPDIAKDPHDSKAVHMMRSTILRRRTHP